MSSIILSMIIVGHVIIAILSIVMATYILMRPSKTKLYATTGLIALTLVSGTYLVISSHTRLLPACTMGLGYLAIAGGELIAAKHKLAMAATRDKTISNRAQ